MSVRHGERATDILRIQCVYRKDVMDCVCAKYNQPFLMTQYKVFKRVIGFCAMRYGNAINVAISLESPET